MPKIFVTLDKIKPFYKAVEDILMVVCKLLLIADIGITCMSVLGRYVSFIPDPSWTEEVVLTLMSYMAVLSAAIAIRKGAHIRMTCFDNILPKSVIKFLNIIADIAVLVLAVIMVNVGWRYANKIGKFGRYISMPSVSLFWNYLPIPMAGIAMIFFEIEALYNHIKSIVVKEGK